MTDETKPDGVIFLHGILRSKYSMAGLERAFRREGYNTLNIDYPSRRFSIRQLADRIAPRVHRFANKLDGRVHCVTHSMGGLIVRALLKRHRPANLGRVVMLGPPNKGSEATDFWKNIWLYKTLYGPAGQEMATGPEGPAGWGDTADYPLGVIAGDRTVDFFHSSLIKGKDDGKVSVESTRMPGMADHIVLPATHSLMMYNPKVVHQTLHFIEHGRFDHETKR